MNSLLIELRKEIINDEIVFSLRTQKLIKDINKYIEMLEKQNDSYLNDILEQREYISKLYDRIKL